MLVPSTSRCTALNLAVIQSLLILSPQGSAPRAGCWPKPPLHCSRRGCTVRLGPVKAEGPAALGRAGAGSLLPYTDSSQGFFCKRRVSPAPCRRRVNHPPRSETLLSKCPFPAAATAQGGRSSGDKARGVQGASCPPHITHLCAHSTGVLCHYGQTRKMLSLHKEKRVCVVIGPPPTQKPVLVPDLYLPHEILLHLTAPKHCISS